MTLHGISAKVAGEFIRINEISLQAYPLILTVISLRIVCTETGKNLNVFIIPFDSFPYLSNTKAITLISRGNQQ